MGGNRRHKEGKKAEASAQVYSDVSDDSVSNERKEGPILSNVVKDTSTQDPLPSASGGLDHDQAPSTEGNDYFPASFTGSQGIYTASSRPFGTHQGRALTATATATGPQVAPPEFQYPQYPYFMPYPGPSMAPFHGSWSPHWPFCCS